MRAVAHKPQAFTGGTMNNKDKDYFVHESSYVDNGAKIGKETKIWHYSHVMTNSVIGEECTLGQNVLVGPNVHIGDNVKVQNNVSVYEGVTLEDDVFCGPSMVFTNVNTPRSGYPTENEDYLETLVRKGATIGGNATIVCGHTIRKTRVHRSRFGRDKRRPRLRLHIRKSRETTRLDL